MRSLAPLVPLVVLGLCAGPAAAQTAGFDSDGSAYASGRRSKRPASRPAAESTESAPLRDMKLVPVVGGALGDVLGSALSAPAPSPYTHVRPAPVVGDDDESSPNPAISGGVGDARDIISGYRAKADDPMPFDQDASIAGQRAYVKKKVKYSHNACDPTGTADMATGVDCSCLLLHANPKYFQRKNGEYVRTADGQHALMVANGDDSLSAMDLRKGDVLYLRNRIDDPAEPIAHTGRVTKIETCDRCSGCSADNGDVCLTMLHAPRSGRTVSEVNTTFHRDKDKNGDAAFCIHKRSGAISQCLTGGGRFP